MNTRELKPDDIKLVESIYNRFYSEDFELPDFFNNFMNIFAITNDEDEIIIAGGIKPVAETIILTDKNQNIFTIGRALLEALAISIYTCNKFGIDDLYVFAKDKKYIRHLKQYGFNNCFKALSMKVPNGKEKR